LGIEEYGHMMTIATDEANRVLTIKAEGTITEDDIDRCTDDLEERFPQFGVRIRGGEKGGIGLMLDWEKLDGWAMGAKTLGTVTTRAMSDAIHRVAIVADEKWRGEEERMEDIASEAKVRFFTPAERDDAMAWLTAK
jgi:SpoIIAA-like